MSAQLQLRHWQQIKQAQALEYAGTPEGSAALAESKRYGLAADRIDELAAQIEKCVAALNIAIECDVQGYVTQHAREAIEACDSGDAAILRQRDARIAANALRDYVKTIPGGSIVDPQLIADDMRRVAAELERSKNG